jgi:hypothetical protein
MPKGEYWRRSVSFPCHAEETRARLRKRNPVLSFDAHWRNSGEQIRAESLPSETNSRRLAERLRTLPGRRSSDVDHGREPIGRGWEGAEFLIQLRYRESVSPAVLARAEQG